MGKIHTLSEETISKIAAGEVIERPCYAVKELVDNAIDAGASYITIFIEEAGLRKIVVTDNGEGMDYEDVLLCFKLHTTSKINDEDQLIGIKTMGFRGEALASIASISNLNIKSRKLNDDKGTLVELHFGEIVNTQPIGSAIGTTITITNLFHTIPARRKFLKSERAEFRLITDIVIQYALVFPHIRFFLKHNNKIILDLPQHQPVLERAGYLVGEEVAKNLIPIKCDESYISIRGYIGTPQEAKPHNPNQFLFINNRPVKDTLIRTAIKEAYGTFLEKSSQPSYILFVTMPPEAVDVNIHPRKTEVHFLDKMMVYQTIQSSIQEILLNHTSAFQYGTDRKTLTTSFAGQQLKELVLKTTINKTADIIQLHDLYLVTETTEGIILIDQHAADERIQYERLIKAWQQESNKHERYRLGQAMPLVLSLLERDILDEHRQLFQAMGFVIEDFHDNLILTEVPSLLRDRQIIPIILELLTLIKDDKGITIDTTTNRMLTSLACRSSVMQGERLTKEHMLEIINTLELIPNNLTCPHGRPTKIAISQKELLKMFRRL